MAESENPVTFDGTAGSIEVEFNPLAGLDTVNLNGDVFSPEAIAEAYRWLGSDGFTVLTLPAEAMDKVLYDLFIRTKEHEG